MPKRPCLDCGALSPNTRCPTHTRARDRARGTSTQRGYGWTHQQQRAHDLANHDPADPCPRCGLPLGDGPLDEGHTEDRAGYLGLMHQACNRDTARRQHP
jgi:hypothetical protein